MNILASDLMEKDNKYVVKAKKNTYGTLYNRNIFYLNKYIGKFDTICKQILMHPKRNRIFIH